MPDEPCPEIRIFPLGVVQPTVFSFTRSDIEYLQAIMSGRLCSLSDMDASGTLLREERRHASDLYHMLQQIRWSMDAHKVREAELRLPTSTQPTDR